MIVMVVLLRMLMIDVVVMVPLTLCMCSNLVPEINWHIYYDTSALEIIVLANCHGEVWSGAICVLHYS